MSLEQQVRSLRRIVIDILIREVVNMAAIDDLKTSIDALRAEDVIIIAAIQTLGTKVSDLQALLDASGNLTPEIQAASQAIQDEVAKLAAAVAPPPAPVPAV